MVRARVQSAELQLALAMIESWKEGFGAKYPPIAAGYAALQQKGYEFPHVQQNAICAQQQAAATLHLRKRIRQVQLDQMQAAMPEIEDLIVEMNRIFDILVPTLDAFNLFDDLLSRENESGDGSERSAATARDAVDGNDVHAVSTRDDDDDDDDGVEWEDVADDDGEDVEWEAVRNSDAGDEEANGFVGDAEESDDDDEDDSLERMDMNQIVQAYGLGSSSYQLTIAVPTTADGICAKSSDNDVLFQHLADGILRIRKRFLPLVHEWRAHAHEHRDDATGADDADADERDVLYRIHDLQQRLDQIVSKWGDLVEEPEKQRSARITPSIVSMPLSAYKPRNPSQPVAPRKRKRVLLLQDTRGKAK